MIRWEAYPFYMCSVAVLAAIANIRLLMLIEEPSLIFPEFDGIIMCQTVSALIQLILVGVLCPRTVFDDDYFAVAFDGVIYNFSRTIQVFYFAILVLLATNSVITTAISLYHRRLVIMGRKISVFKVCVLLAIYPVLYLQVMIFLMITGDWTETIHSPEATEFIRFKFPTPSIQIVMGVTAASSVIVFLYAIFVSWEANRLLSSRDRIAIKAMKEMRTTVWKAFLVHATIPLITGLVILSWYLNYMKIIQGCPLFEYFLFGVGPLLLRLQAMITPESVGVHRRVSIDSISLVNLFFECVLSLTITALGYTLLVVVVSLSVPLYYVVRKFY